jgi:hypothetical protein
MELAIEEGGVSIPPDLGLLSWELKGLSPMPVYPVLWAK